MIKRFGLVLLALGLLLGNCAGAQAAETTDTPKLYELSADKDVLTVWLPANPTTGYTWSYEISDPALLQLLTEEYEPDEAEEGMVGVGGTWTASFLSTLQSEGGGGPVQLKLLYTRPSESEFVEPAAGYILDVWVVENGTMWVEGLWTLEPIENPME